MTTATENPALPATKNIAIRVMLENIIADRHGDGLRAAFDRHIGPGAYDRLAGEIWDAAHAAH